MVRSAASSASSSRTVVGVAGSRLQIRSMMTASSSPNPLIRTTDLLVIKEPLDLVARFEPRKLGHTVARRLRTNIVDHPGRQGPERAHAAGFSRFPRLRLLALPTRVYDLRS